MAGDAIGPAASALPLPRAADRVPPPADPSDLRLRLWVFEQNLSSVGIDRLEATVASAPGRRLAAWFEQDAHAREVAFLRTCQRVVLTAVTDGEPPSADLGVLDGWAVWTDGAAVRRLYRIAAGLESCAPGEREVRSQIRAMASAVVSRHPRPVLRSLLTSAADAAAELDDDASDSVADLGIDWLLQRLPANRRAEVIVIGAGTVGRRAAERLAPFAAVTVVYRTHPPDPAWADRWNVRAIPAGELGARLAQVDAVVAAAKTSGRVLAPDDLPPDDRPGPRWFVDLGLPRNIDPEVGRRAGVDLVDLDHLPRGRSSSARLAELAHAVDAAAADGLRAFSAAAAEPWVAELRRWAETVRREEWERASQFVTEDPASTALAYERMSERVVRRLLAGPTETLRGLSPGPEADRRRRRIVDLFRVDDRGP